MGMVELVKSVHQWWTVLDRFIIFDYLNKSNKRVTGNDRIMTNGNRVVTGGELEWIWVYRYGSIDSVILIKAYWYIGID